MAREIVNQHNPGGMGVAPVVGVRDGESGMGSVRAKRSEFMETENLRDGEI